MSLGAIAAFAAGLALAIALVFAAVWGLLSLFSGGQLPPAPPATASPIATDQVPPQPRLQVAPASDLATLEATQEALLNSYGLVEDTDEVAHIPLDRAQELLLTRGLPTPAPTASATATGVVTATTPAGPDADAAASGQQLFQEQGCSECHLQDGSGQGPSLVGVFGSQVTLQDGQTVTADAAYVRRSILEPRAQIVAGYEPVMPSFSGELSEQQIEQLIAYVRSLAD